MREAPSDELVALLHRLGLAREEQFAAARRRARTLARDVPMFDTVWVDALASLRVLSPYQAAEINAGRGAALEIAGQVLVEPITQHGYAQVYAGRSIESRAPTCIAIATVKGQDRRNTQRALTSLVEKLSRMESAIAPQYAGSGCEADRCWLSFAHGALSPASDWLVRNGRMPPEAVLEVARQMAGGLAQLAGQEVVHGDLSAESLWLGGSGNVQLVLAGLRALVRPEEGYACTDLPVDAYNYLAPERIADGTPPTLASDLYAAGCLWWHLLAGRAPLSGGDSLAKVKAAHQGRIRDIQQFAPETPAPLAAAIRACTQYEIARRPASFGELATTLGPSTRQGRLALAGMLAQRRSRVSQLTVAARAVKTSRHAPVWLAATAGCALMLAAVSWPLWSRQFVATSTNVDLSRTEAPVAEPGLLAADPDAVPMDRRDPRSAPCEEHSDAALASFEQNATDPIARQASAVGFQQDLLLPAETVLDAAGLQLRSGQSVRAEAGRARVVVPRAGLAIDAEGVTLENIDFVVEGSQFNAASNGPGTALRILAAQIQLRGCTFQPASELDRSVTAIHWAPQQESAGGAREGSLAIANCVFRGVAAGVECVASGAANVELTNSLHLGPGPLWRVAHDGSAGNLLSLFMTRSTLRDAAALLDIARTEDGQSAGQIAIETNECVFAPQYGAALVRVFDAADSKESAQRFAWTGQGSLLSPESRFATWYDREGEPHALDDGLVSIEGLVGGQFDFADSADAGAHASQVVRWTAPLRSTDAPGIRAAALPRPQRALDMGQSDSLTIPRR